MFFSFLFEKGKDCDNYDFFIKKILFYSSIILFFMYFCVYVCFLSNLFDPGRSYCYWDSIKPCKLNELFLVRGVRLSNTWITYP